MVPRCLSPERIDFQAGKLSLFDRGDDHYRTPMAHRVEINTEISIPAPRGGVGLHLAGAEGDPDAPEPLTSAH